MKMKRLTLLLVMALFLSLNTTTAQEELYLVFEFMKVDNEQGSAYAETEATWEKIHQQRVNSGEIEGWDLWSLQPGGEDQHFQYVTVTLYNDPVKMMEGPTMDAFMTSAKKAYPGLSNEQLMKKLEGAGKTRDLAARVYLHQIASTKDDFKMDIGTVASFDLMKTNPGKASDYVKAEKEIFQPTHQAMVDAGAKGSWGLLEVILPAGSDTYTDYITVNMYKNYDQFFKSWNFDRGESSNEQMKKIQDGIATRDMKYVFMGTLEKKVRKPLKVKTKKD